MSRSVRGASNTRPSFGSTGHEAAQLFRLRTNMAGGNGPAGVPAVGFGDGAGVGVVKVRSAVKVRSVSREQREWEEGDAAQAFVGGVDR